MMIFSDLCPVIKANASLPSPLVYATDPIPMSIYDLTIKITIGLLPKMSMIFNRQNQRLFQTRNLHRACEKSSKKTAPKPLPRLFVSIQERWSPTRPSVTPTKACWLHGFAPMTWLRLLRLWRTTWAHCFLLKIGAEVRGEKTFNLLFDKKVVSTAGLEAGTFAVALPWRSDGLGLESGPRHICLGFLFVKTKRHSSKIMAIQSVSRNLFFPSIGGRGGIIFDTFIFSNVRCVDEVLARMPMGTVGNVEGTHSEHPIPDAFEGCQCRRIC